MTYSTVGVLVGLLAQPAAADSTAAQPEASTAAPVEAPNSDPELKWSDDGLTVARPAYGMSVDGVTRTADGKPHYELSPKNWHQMVRENPTLARYQRRSKLLGPGIGALVVGGSWLALSGALAMDGYYAKTATGALFQWGVPATVLVSGAIMTSVGVSGRRSLEKAQDRFYFSPYASQTGAGATVGGRF